MVLLPAWLTCLPGILSASAMSIAFRGGESLSESSNVHKSWWLISGLALRAKTMESFGISTKLPCLRITACHRFSGPWVAYPTAHH